MACTSNEQVVFTHLFGDVCAAFEIENAQVDVLLGERSLENERLGRCREAHRAKDHVQGGR